MAIILCAILGLAIGLIAIGMYYHSKNKTADQIYMYLELLDEKVKSIAAIIAKTHKNIYTHTIFN